MHAINDEAALWPAAAERVEACRPDGDPPLQPIESDQESGAFAI